VWAYVTPDGASTDTVGWRRGTPGGPAARLVENGVLLDAEFSDAIFTLPPADEAGGKIYWFKRVDDPGTTYVAEIYPASTADTIQGDPVYSPASQWASVVLVSDGEATASPSLAKSHPFSRMMARIGSSSASRGGGSAGQPSVHRRARKPMPSISFRYSRNCQLQYRLRVLP
jgi:hypothetical protein